MTTKPEPANIATLKHDNRNARKHTPRNLDMIERSLQRNGFGRSVLLANDGTIIAGNATIEAAGATGLEDVQIIESDGTKVIAIKRTDIDPESPQFYELAIADNRTAELAEWDTTILAGLIDDDAVNLDDYWFPDELEDALLAEEDHRVTPASPDEEEYGEPDDSLFWPEIRVRVPPEAMQTYQRLMTQVGEGSDSERFVVLLERANAAS